MALYGSLLFHLNLRYSAIEREERPLVVARCYRPLLALVDELPWLQLTLEASAHTLELIAEHDPDWVRALAARWREGRVELVGSGDTQLIGPLVPASVNRWNQSLGCEAYERLLGARPRTALVNELAWSQGLVDAYLDAGYDTLLVEWNNPRKHHPEWEGAWRYRMARTESPAGRAVDLAWIDAVAFQKFQRAVHDDLEVDDYVDWVRAQAGPEARHLFLYASDAEIFDHRPGRYETEAELQRAGEWRRVRSILEALHAADVCFTTPGRLRDEPGLRPTRSLRLNSAADPVPVKKQPKYNATRWALSGRDDGRLNRLCHVRAQTLEHDGGSPADWRALVRAWASDLRTHLTERRWERILPALEAQAAPVRQRTRTERTVPSRAAPPVQTSVEHTSRRLRIAVGALSVDLSPRRGLAIEAFRVAALGPGSLLGTVPHGALDDIDWAADFYSGHLVAELPARARVTDLAAVEPELLREAGRVEVRARVATALGPVAKTIVVTPDALTLTYDLSAWAERPSGSLRLGIVTLAPEAFGADLSITSANGGAPERFPLVAEFDHGAGISPIVSAQAAFGATDGRLLFDDGAALLELTWDPGRAAALPLVTHRRVAGRRFVRVAFSLSELDETHRPGATLPPFSVTLRARSLLG